MSAEVRICPSAWLLTSMLLAAALEQSAVGIARPTISGSRAIRASLPMTRASAMCQRRASISPPRKAAMPTMANRRPKVFILAKIFSVGVSGACRFMRGAAVSIFVGPEEVTASSPTSASIDSLTGADRCIRLVGALVPFCSGFWRIMWDSGMCSVSQQAPMTARTNHRMRLGRLHGGGRGRRPRFIAF